MTSFFNRVLVGFLLGVLFLLSTVVGEGAIAAPMGLTTPVLAKVAEPTLSSQLKGFIETISNTQEVIDDYASDVSKLVPKSLKDAQKLANDLKLTLDKLSAAPAGSAERAKLSKEFAKANVKLNESVAALDALTAESETVADASKAAATKLQADLKAFADDAGSALREQIETKVFGSKDLVAQAAQAIKQIADDASSISSGSIDVKSISDHLAGLTKVVELASSLTSK
jgi:murein DD-endopeptidase MepM/ murein hydrolase activator NlpD